MLVPASNSGGGPWATTWRPAPEHLVSEWRSLNSRAKEAIARVRSEQEKNQPVVLLRDCCLYDAGAAVAAEALKECTHLQSINFQGNSIGDDGVTQLLQVVKRNPSLHTLVLGQNVIGDRGAMEIAEVFEEHRSLRKLTLESNQIGDDGASRLVTAISRSGRKHVECILTSNPTKRFDSLSLADLALAADTVTDLAVLGITVGQLLKLYTDGRASGLIDPSETTTGEVVTKILLPACEATATSYVINCAGNDPITQPLAQVVHAWDGLFEDLMRAVASHACGKRDPSLDPNDLQWRFSPQLTGKSYFIDGFCVNQHWHVNSYKYRSYFKFASHPAFSHGQAGCQVDKIHLVGEKLDKVGGRVLCVVDSNHVMLSRTQCLYELRHAVKRGVPVDVFFGSMRELPHGKVDTLLQTANCSSDETKELLYEEVRDSPGGFETFNEQILGFLQERYDADYKLRLGI